MGPGGSLAATVRAADAPASFLAPGQEFGPYLIVQLLGRGGMGEVYEAEELETGRRLALKLFNRPLDSPVERERFLREGRLAAAINHPHTVYIFGSDEIRGIPVIAMELVPGGTLKDRVRMDGPLRARDAADTILQVIAGLEAAACAGILHRDIKPGNCFVDLDGSVKVGDFGLSISTLGMLPPDGSTGSPATPRAADVDDTHLTTMGTILGTPTFASPEQLQGKALDVRSDIYSVGATLYFLLSGQAPFEARDLTALIHKAIHEPPPALRKARRGIPAQMAAIVERCLAKDPGRRFADYAALAAALQPFATAEPVPAALGLRAAAFVIDVVLLTIAAVIPMSLISFLIIRWWGWDTGTSDPAEGRRMVAFLSGLMTFFRDAVLPAAFVAFFAVFEGRRGATPGKRTCGLKVAAPDGSQPALWQAALRAAIILAVMQYAGRVVWAAMPRGWVVQLAELPLPLGAVAVVCLFVTARRSNLMAGIHDLASRTRVVMAAVAMPRVAVHAPGPAPVWGLSGARIGPYSVCDAPSPVPGILLAADLRLKRNVWVRPVPPGEPRVSAARRDLSRPTRLRWLAGRRRVGDSWDAYEAIQGTPIEQAGTRPWAVVRAWLAALAGECDASSRDGTLSAVTKDHVLVDASGAVRLLDWPVGRHDSAASGVDSKGVPKAGARVDQDSAQRLLHDVAETSLRARVDDRQDRNAQPLPLRGAALLDALATRRFPSVGDLADAARHAAQGPTVVTRRVRGRALLAAVVGPLILCAVVDGYLRMPTVHPDWITLAGCLREYQRTFLAPTPDALKRREALLVVITARFSWMIENTKDWPLPRHLDTDPRVARAIVASNPTPDRAAVARAERVLEPFLAPYDRSLQLLRFRITGAGWLLTARFFAWVWVLITWTGVAVVIAVAIRGGIVLRGLRLAVVGPDGLEATRLRILGRSAPVWVPLAALGAALAPGFGEAAETVGTLWNHPGVYYAQTLYIAAARGSLVLSGTAWLWIMAVGAALTVTGLVAALASPPRGLNDRLADTSLVPR